MGKLQWEAAFSSRVAWSLSCLLRRSRTCVVVRLTRQSGQQLGLSRRQQALKRPPLRGKDESLHLYWNFLQVYHSPVCSDSPWAKPIKLKHVEPSVFFFFPSLGIDFVYLLCPRRAWGRRARIFTLSSFLSSSWVLMFPSRPMCICWRMD